MFQALLYFLIFAGCQATFKIFPYVTLSENVYNVTDCSTQPSHVIDYNYDCYYPYKKSNGLSKCCADILNKVTNETELNICYKNTTNSHLYYCENHIDYMENISAYLTLSIIGGIFIIGCLTLLLYFMVSVISRSFFRNRYQPL